MTKHCIILIALCCTITSTAQRYLGAATGNYNVTNSVFVNPASIAGSSERMAINIVSANIGVDNNLGKIGSIGNISKTLKTSDSEGNNIFKFTNKDRFSMMLPMVELRGPALVYGITSRHSIAFTTRVRVFNEFNNFDKNLFNAITDPSGFISSSNVALNLKDFNWTAHAWSEFGLSYASTVLDKKTFQLKAGVTLRYLAGIGYIGLKGKNLDVEYQKGADSISATNSDIQFASNIKSVSDAFSNGLPGNSLFGGSSGGHGLGGDVGISFLYRPDADYEQSKGYRFSLCASVTDLGAINYNSSFHVNVTGNGYLSGNGIKDNVKDYNDFSNYVKRQGFSADTGTTAQKVYLPTALVIGGDYHAYKHYYVNAMFVGNLAGNNNFGSRYYNQITLTPRYDSRVFCVSAPFTYNMLSNSLRFGVGLRVTGFFIGSDDIGALFSSNQYGFNFYFGGMVPIYWKKTFNQNFQL